VTTTLATAREIGARLTTDVQARAAIRLTLATLRRSADLVRGFSVSDKAIGWHGAAVSRIDQQVARVATLQRRPFGRPLADAVGLAVTQAGQLLRSIRADVRASRESATIDRLFQDFAEAMRAILAGALTLAAHSLSPLLLVAVAWYALTRR